MPASMLRRSLVVLLVFFGLLLHLPVGFKLAHVSFTYGRLGLDPGHAARTLATAGACLLAGLVFEGLVRGVLLAWLIRRRGRWRGFLLHLVVVNLLLAWPIYHYGRLAFELGLPEFLLYENLLQLTWTGLFLGTGSWLTAGMAHGLFLAFRVVVINNVAFPFETLYFYTVAHPVHYTWFLALAAMVAVITLTTGFLLRKAP